MPATDRRGRVSRYRVELPHAGIVETQRNRFEATEYAERRGGWKGRYLGIRDRVLGSTLANYRLESERLSKLKALAVFSSDALSSNAYATQEILFVLVLAGPLALKYSLLIAGLIAVLLIIVIASYRQTVKAYPSGGGAYIVAHDNFGVGPGLIAASSLLIDYVLTVSVSIAAGMDALASLNPDFRPFAMPLAVGVVAVVAIINLRGVSESGTIFSIPTYAFVVTLALAIVVALVRIVGGGNNPLQAGTPDPSQLEGPFQGLTLLLFLRAFSNGCAALTGVEAISNGVQAFKKPESENASKTLLSLGIISVFLFMGITLVARYYAFIPHEDNTIPAQLGAKAFGEGSILFGFLQVMTAGILILAANTSFADFPRLSAILARDGYMPRIFHNRGNRLVFSSGIIVLAALSSLLLIVFDAKTNRLIPLYALGVFLSFTLSQSGMVKHAWRLKEKGWQRSVAVSGFGAVATAIVFAVILSAKFLEGAWVVVLLIPILAMFTWSIGRFYKRLRRTLHVAPEAVLEMAPHGESNVPVVVPVEDINLATVMALGAACGQSKRVIAVHVQVDPDEPSTVEARWREQFLEIPLVVIDSPYRSVSEPVASFVEDMVRRAPYEVEVLEVQHWYQRPLVNQSLTRLQGLLRGRRQVTVKAYPFAVGSTGRKRRTAGIRG